MSKNIACITMARNDEFFLNHWIEYYGREFGRENLYIYLDGMDQKIPAFARGTNIKRIPHRDDLSRLKNDRHRIDRMSDMAADLFANGYDIVIGCDSDEFLVIDPDAKTSLAAYLSKIENVSSVSGLGMDIGQDLNREDELDPGRPFLQQREYALLSTRYTKPVILFRKTKNEKRKTESINRLSSFVSRFSFPRWGSGFHRVKKHNFHIDKHLYLFHFGMVDYNMVQSRFAGRDETWKRHVRRQISRTILTITNKKRRKWKYAKIARFIQTFFRAPYAWNKPCMFGLKLIVQIPERFKKVGV